MSRMWLAWISLNSNGAAMRPAGGVDVFGPRIRAMMASIMSSAFTRPSTMCSRSRLAQPELGPPLDDLLLVLDVDRERVRRSSRRGTLSTSASMCTAKFVCIGVCL